MSSPTSTPPATPAVQFIRADLYAHCMNLLAQNVELLHQSPDSIMDLDRVSLFNFVPDTNSAHGVFADVDGKTYKSVRMMGQLGTNQMVNPYFTLTARDKVGIPTQRITNQKTKLYVLVPGSANLADEHKELLRNQFRVADMVQRNHEEKLEVPDENNGIRINDLVRDADGSSMVTTLTSQEKMWSRSYTKAPKPKDIFSKNSGPTELSADTLATWTDPEAVYNKVSNKNDYKLNTNLQIFDKDGELVHPSNYDKILLPGTWILFDAHLRLWDFSRADGHEKAPGGRTRTYHWEFTSIRVLLPPFQGTSKKRPAETPLAPPATRAWKVPKLSDLLGESAFELSVAGPSTPSTYASSSSSRSPPSSPNTAASASQPHPVGKKSPSKVSQKVSRKGKEKEIPEDMDEDN